jgi:antagonist of KipI
MTLIAGSFVFEQSAVVAVTGADVSFQCGRKLPMWEAVEVGAGAEISGGPMANGARSYLAVRGGIRVKPELGSASTDLGGKFGGLSGRALRDGDVISVNSGQWSVASSQGEGQKASGQWSVASAQRGEGGRKIRKEVVEELRGSGAIRVTKGLQWEWFEETSRRDFFERGYEVTQQSNRAGLRLMGAEERATSQPSAGPLNGAPGSGELLSEGVPLGAIQVPANGQPIILFVDQQTTGGYPKIANVIAADLHRVGQMRPGDKVWFELVTVERALELLRATEKMLDEAFA